MEIKQRIEKIEKELEEIKKEVNKSDGWEPEYDETYYFYNKDTGEVDFACWADEELDYIRLKNKVVFKTEEEAQRYADYMKAKEEYNYEFSTEEWEDEYIPKNYIYYDCVDKIIAISICYYIKNIGNLYFKTEEQAQEFINKYNNEILEFEFGVKE